jgi:hypothetical protein
MLWVGFAIAILVGVFLYWCRCRHRVLYGAAEILVALLLLYLFFFPEAQGVVGRNSWIGSLGSVWGFYLSRTVTLFGGLYALVRGLDNIDALEKWNRVRQGVRREGLWMRRWMNVFGLIFGMIGVVIIFLWGPPQPSFQQGVWVGLNPGTRLLDRGGKTVAEIDAETAATKTFYQHMSQLGLVFIFIGFGCQLIAVWPRPWE